jgi:hypothetical protein
MTLLELINRIKYTALRTSTADIRPLLQNTEILVEVILPRCMDAVADKMVRTPDGVNAMRDDITIAFVLGVGTLPTTIMEEHLETITFLEDLTTSWCPSWMEFMSHPYPGGMPMDYSRYTVKGSQIFYHERVQLKNSFTGNRTIAVIRRPVLPTSVSDQVVLRDTLLQQLITFAATIVNGSTPLSQIGLDYDALETVAKQAE